MITAFYNTNNRNNKLPVRCLFVVYKEHNVRVHLKYNQKEIKFVYVI